MGGQGKERLGGTIEPTGVQLATWWNRSDQIVLEEKKNRAPGERVPGEKLSRNTRSQWKNLKKKKRIITILIQKNGPLSNGLSNTLKGKA